MLCLKTKIDRFLYLLPSCSLKTDRKHFFLTQNTVLTQKFPGQDPSWLVSLNQSRSSQAITLLRRLRLMTYTNLQHNFKTRLIQNILKCWMLSLSDRHCAMASPLHYPDLPWLYELSCPAIGCSYLENESGKWSWVGKSQRISKFHQHFKFYRKPVILEESDVLSLGIHTRDLESATGFPSLPAWCWVSIFWALETIPVQSLLVCLPCAL